MCKRAMSTKMVSTPPSSKNALCKVKWMCCVQSGRWKHVTCKRAVAVSTTPLPATPWAK